MRADEVPGLLHEFLSRNRELFGELAVAPSPPADPARFPNEVHKLQPFSSGVYLFHRKVSGDLLYVGTAVNIRNRIYRHFGKGVSYETSAGSCSFPHFRLTQWEKVPQEVREVCRSGGFLITALRITPPEASRFLESLLIYVAFARGQKPSLNISF